MDWRSLCEGFHRLGWFSGPWLVARDRGGRGRVEGVPHDQRFYKLIRMGGGANLNPWRGADSADET